MGMSVLLSPNEVAALAGTSRTVVEKALEQKAFGTFRARADRRLLPIHAVAVAAAVKSLGRRLNVSDKRLMAQRLSLLSPAALKTAEVELAPSMIVRIGVLTRDAVERAERYMAARDTYIEMVEGVQGGRPVIKGTRITVSAIHDRLISGDTIEALIDDYPDIPIEAFEAALLYGKTHPPVGRPSTGRARSG